MPLLLDDDQTMLRDTARALVAEKSPIATVRALRDADDRVGYAPNLWTSLAELGLTGVMAPIEAGGTGLGHVEAGVIAAELGRNVALSPFVSTSIGAVKALEAADAGLALGWLERIVYGSATAALAFDEAARHRPNHVSLRAEKKGNGFILNGRKRAVVQGHNADLLIVSARTADEAGSEDGITLFAIERAQLNAQAEAHRLVDSSLAVDLQFDNVAVAGDAIIGELSRGWPTLGKILDSVRAVHASELVGIGEAAAAMTIDYISGRKQFGVCIGSFQALQHRAAQVHGELQIAAGAALRAQQALDAGDRDASMLASVAKAISAQAATLAVQEGVQMHGGVGMTDEYDIGLTMKRVRVLADNFGDANFHVDRFARINGY